MPQTDEFEAAYWPPGDRDMTQDVTGHFLTVRANT